MRDAYCMQLGMLRRELLDHAACIIVRDQKNRSPAAGVGSQYVSCVCQMRRRPAPRNRACHAACSIRAPSSSMITRLTCSSRAWGTNFTQPSQSIRATVNFVPRLASSCVNATFGSILPQPDAFEFEEISVAWLYCPARFPPSRSGESLTVPRTIASLQLCAFRL